MKWILQTGLGADIRLFTPILDLLPEYQYVAHDVPQPTETMEQYAGRLGQHIDRNGPVVLCGISFGGMLSSILCEEVQPAALVLMSSTPSPEALAGSARTFEWLSRVLPDTLAAWMRTVGHGATTWVESMSPQQAEAFREMVRQSPLDLIRRGGHMIMEWERPPEIRCPRFHLHGANDTLIPARKVEPTHLVADAGHLLNLTHPQPARDFVCEVISELNGQA